MDSLTLEAAVELFIDHRGKTPKKLGGDFTSTGVPVASALLVDGGQLDLKGCRFVSKAMAERWMPEPTRKYDVLLTSEAPLGRAALVPTDEPLVLGQRLFGLRGRSGVMESRFLYYALTTSRVQRDLEGRATGTTVFGIRQSALRRVRVPAPPLPEQQAIAEVLGALDDKIAANRNLISTALDLGESIYQSTVEGSTQCTTFSEHLDFEYGKSLKTADRQPGSIVVVGSGGITGTHDVALIPEPGIVVGRKGSVGEVHWINGPHFPIDTTFYIRNRSNLPLEYWFFALRAAGFPDMNSDSAVPGLNRNRALMTETPAPKASELFNRTVPALFAAMAQREGESKTLVELRDTLLPALMDGTLRVKDAERTVREAL